mmetsp:Transcript_22339/g.39853  ORF Transcript_22339/g.39853 Transcript_22339/m.39853 type:complete len:224 (+) Transcript_22339:661-1332(+)
MPFLRRNSCAVLMSPLHSVSAFLQSIIPAPDWSRSCFTSFADTATLGAASSSFSGAAASFFAASFFGSATAFPMEATSSAKLSAFFSMPSPSSYLSNRRIITFSPVAAMVSLSSCSTLLSVSLMKGWFSSAMVSAVFFSRPSTIFSRMFSGLARMSSFPISISFSLAISAGSMSSTDTTRTSGHAAICIAMSAARPWKISPRATKSVSQFTSTSTPSRSPAWM